MKIITFKDYLELNQGHSITFHNCGVSIKSLDYITLLYCSESGGWSFDRGKKTSPLWSNVPHPSGDGYFDEYEFQVNDMMNNIVRFRTKVIHQSVKYILDSNIKTNNMDVETIKYLKPYAESNNMAITFKFIDDKEKLELTGSMGPHAKEVMDNVLSNIKDSMDRANIKPIIAYHSVDKKEAKRAEFYDRIIENVITFKDRFKDNADPKLIRTFYILK